MPGPKPMNQNAGFVESGQFMARDDIPIYDEGAPMAWERDEAGKPVLENGAPKVARRATLKDLHEIAAVNNSRVSSTGDKAPLVIGHVKPGLPESYQPEVVGFASNYRVANFGGKNVLMARWEIFKSQFDYAMKFPRRSVEIHEKDKVIDPIALLGATTPARDLGLVYCNKDGDNVVQCMHDCDYSQAAPDQKLLIDTFLAALFETDQWKSLVSSTKVKNMNDSPAVQNAKCPKCSHEYEQKVQLAKTPATDDAVRMEVDQYRIKLSKLEADLASTNAELTKVRSEARRESRERQLVQLEAEGFVLNRAEELQDADHLSDDQFKVKLERMRKNYRKSPVSQAVIPTADNTEGGADGKVKLDKGTMMKIASYATLKGCTFQDALQEYEAGKLEGVLAK